ATAGLHLPSAKFNESGRTTLTCPARTRTSRAGFRSRFKPQGRARPGTPVNRSHPSVQEIKPDKSGTCSLGQDDAGGESHRPFRTSGADPEFFKLHLLPAAPVV